MPKQTIRQEMKVLCSQHAGELAEKSALICKKIISSGEYEGAQEIFAYMALPDEVDLTEIIKASLRDGKKVAVPKIMDFDKGVMQFFYLDGAQQLNAQTESGTLGINEPDENLLTPVNLDELKNKKTLILVPGRAFTTSGNRLGRGKGFYDRFLGSELCRGEQVVMAGVCFDFQIKKSLPIDDRDIKMDLVYTTSQE